MFDSTLHDFAGRLNRDKTEGLKVSAEPAPLTEVPFLGESTTVKHVGALLHNRGSHAAETTARVAKCIQKLGWVATLGVKVEVHTVISAGSSSRSECA